MYYTLAYYTIIVLKRLHPWNNGQILNAAL